MDLSLRRCYPSSRLQVSIKRLIESIFLGLLLFFKFQKLFSLSWKLCDRLDRARASHFSRSAEKRCFIDAVLLSAPSAEFFDSSVPG